MYFQMFSHDDFGATLPENYMDWRNMPTASPNRRFELLPLVAATLTSSHVLKLIYVNADSSY